MCNADPIAVNIVSRLLSDEDIVIGLDVSEGKRALEAVAMLVERRCHINHAAIFRALWRREQIGSTALGHGIAIPHARVAGISEPIVLVVRTRFPIKFGAPDHQPVSILFVIVVPEHANDEHLQILGTVSALCSNKAFRDRLEAATEPSGIRSLFGGRTGDGPGV